MRSSRHRGWIALLLATCMGVSVWVAWPSRDGTDPVLDTLPAAQDGAPNRAAARSLEPIRDPETDSGEAARLTVSEGKWVVRGEVRRGRKSPLEGARLELDVFAGYETKGTPLESHALVSVAEGRFELWRPEPRQTVTLRFRSGDPDLHVRAHTELVVRGAPPPQKVVLYAYPLDRVLTGLVLNEQEEPLPGATVLTRSRSKGVTTGADGRFRARISSASRSVSLQAAAPGYALLRRNVKPPPPGESSDLRLVLKRGLTVQGSVRDEAGSPIEGARVSTFFTSFFKPALTDGRGRFEISWLEPGREQHSLFVRKEGFIEARAEVEKGRPKPSYDLVLTRGTRVEGRVFDPNRKPLAGARLYIGFSPNAYNRINAVSRDDGSFVFPNVTPGKRRLSAEARGCAPHVVEVDVRAEGPTERIDLFLDAGGSVAGRVHDEDDKPLAGIWVSARLRQGTRHSGGEYIGRRAESDEEGRFRVEHLPQGTIDLEFYATGFVRKTVQSVELGREDLEVTLERSAGLAGKVVDASTGEPIPKFRIRLLDASAGGYSATWSRQGMEFDDPTGVWRSRTDNFKPGTTFTVEALAEGYAPARLRNVTARVGPDPEACIVKLARGGTVSGSVLSPRGTFVAGARIVVSTPENPYDGRRYEDFHGRIATQTDDKGEFELRDVPPGQATLFIEVAGWPVTEDGPFAVSSGQLVQRVIRLTASGEVTGVLFGLDARPVPRVAVELIPQDGARRRRHTATTDGAGRFRFSAGLGAGRYLVRPGKERPDSLHNVVVGKTVTLDKGQRLEVELRPPGVCELLIELRGEQATPGKQSAQLHRLLDGQRPDPEFAPQSILLDGNRKARVRGLAPGRYMVSVFSFAGGIPSGGNAVTTVAAGRPGTAVVELKKGR